ncbi:NTP transferase domain-containing protein [Curtobacterium sp. MCBA15_004]|uniref:nucleotidyltransferase family protein n=1 Tax=unclassified Curtobacterium TaxID=257496 RepID=UPI0020C833D5|nr:NTP transferase domain-containing protein [Curtobacterium sp. MCBA15_004]WIA96005.1 NTP transferase domain-containing protein [Curtobacterium sp. MCBA15_004]
MTGGHVAGLLLAAGAGSRMGTPKALVRSADGRPWVERAVTTLVDGGCDEVVVVLGCAAHEARVLVPRWAVVRTVVAPDWKTGVSASLATGLDVLSAAPASRGAATALVSLVDLPDLPPAAVDRVVGDAGGRPDAVRRAAFGGRPGHPVLLGRAHWSGLLAALRASAGSAAVADRGAGPYLAAVGAEPVDCGDLWDGRDHDLPS